MNQQSLNDSLKSEVLGMCPSILDFVLLEKLPLHFRVVLLNLEIAHLTCANERNTFRALFEFFFEVILKCP